MVSAIMSAAFFLCSLYIFSQAGLSAGMLDLEKPLLQESIVKSINANSKAGWVAGINDRFLNYSVKDFKRLCGSLPKPANEIHPSVTVKRHSRDIKLPKNFDSREAWPQCASTKAVLDQGHCGSCWAFGAVEALTDRFCILTNETVTLSENDLLACCGFECGFGCDGGYPYGAWQYFEHSGVVTSNCDPYFDNMGCHHPGCEPGFDTPRCSKQCRDNEQWSNSKHYSLTSYIVNSDIHDIMAEIYTNGPVEVSYRVYEDFAHYKSGVYKHLEGEYLGGHAVKFLGWGTSESGEDYWIVANSWNRSWGEDGFFKIARGSNECGIESEPVAGIPKFTQIADM